MNATNDHRAYAGTTVVTLLATAAFCCLVACPPTADAAGDGRPDAALAASVNGLPVPMRAPPIL